MSAHIESQQPVRRFNLDFWKFWTGETISSIGSSFTAFALPLLVYKLISIPVWGSRTLLRRALNPSPLEKAGQDVTQQR